MIYFDNCATTKPIPEVIKAVTKGMEENFTNPSSLHRLGMLAEEEVEAVRRLVADYMKVSPEEVIFTSGGTESNNFILRGIIAGNPGNIVTSPLEHSSVERVLSSDPRWEIRSVPVSRYGEIDVKDVLDLIDEKTRCVALTHVNNELGSILPVKEIGRAIHEKFPKVHFHVDGVQAFGKLGFRGDVIYSDSYSFSGHKIHGPKGIGGLYLSKQRHISPLILGGGQERGARSGTENVPGILGLGAAVKVVAEKDELFYHNVTKFRNRMKTRLEETFDDIVFNSPDNGSPYILNISFPHIRGEVILHMLEEEEIYISTASACSSHSSGKNRVLEGIGLPDDLAEGTLRLCFSRFNTEEEIEVFIPKLKTAVREVQEIIGR